MLKGTVIHSGTTTQSGFYLGAPESKYHINYWDYTSGKRGKGGVSGAIPIEN